MHEGADKDRDIVLSSRKDIWPGDDPRNTRLGSWMRKRRLDEMPQLWQVVTGTLSLVAARPLDMPDMYLLEESWEENRFNQFTNEYEEIGPGVLSLFRAMSDAPSTSATHRLYNRLYHERESLALDAYIVWRVFANTVESLKKPNPATLQK